MLIFLPSPHTGGEIHKIVDKMKADDEVEATYHTDGDHLSLFGFYRHTGIC